MNEFSSILPFTESYPVTPNDSADLDKPARSLFVGVGGDVKFTTIGDTTDTWPVPAGFYILGQIKKVFATGTTASSISMVR